MTDTPRRRPPAPTRAGTLSLKPRAAAPAEAAPAARPDARKPATGTGRNRGKASFPEQANTEPVRRSADTGGERPPRQDGERPSRPFGDRPRRPDSDRPARPLGDRPPRAAADRPRDDRSPRHENDRPARADNDRPPRHERKAWTGEPRPAPVQSPLRDDGSIRLSKRMTELGLCSRREADEYIEKGWVRVDGRVVSELGSRVKPGQQVELDRRGQTFQDRRVTILLNKPVGYVSGQAEDGYQPASVLITADNRWAEDPSETRYLRSHQNGLAPAGRLDIDSIGLLVFTQDGRVARALIGEDSAIEKEYHVRVEGTLDAAGLKLLNHGLSLDGVALRPAKVSWLNEDQLRFVLREGKKRQIRRMCELVGLKVVGLKRVRIGRVMLGHLPPGQWRYLSPDEAF
ncbi:pseudouridine synthase [Zoogloea sp.]|uniref:pseudouridine synthase n=1 Tax=Zoogloea sp. TaxID=49181 RepID=UPI0035B19BC0